MAVNTLPACTRARSASDSRSPCTSRTATASDAASVGAGDGVSLLDTFFTRTLHRHRSVAQPSNTRRSQRRKASIAELQQVNEETIEVESPPNELNNAVFDLGLAVVSHSHTSNAHTHTYRMFACHNRTPCRTSCPSGPRAMTCETSNGARP